MSGFAFIVVYLSVSLVAAVVWLALRLQRQRQHVDSPLTAPDPASEHPFLLGFVSPYGGSLLVGAVVTLLGVGMQLAAPWPLLLVVDNGILGEPLPDFLAILEDASATALIAIGAGTTVVLVALGSGLVYLATHLNGTVRTKIETDISIATFIRFQQAAAANPETYAKRDVLARLERDLRSVKDMFAAWFGSILPEMPTVIGVIVVMAFVDPVFALAALTVVPVLAWWIRKARRTTSRADTPKAPSVEVLVATGTAAVIYLAATRVLSDAISMGMLIVLLAYTAQLYAPLGDLAISVVTMARGAGRSLLTELFASADQIVDSPDAIEAPAGSISLRIHDVAFGYDNTWPLLRDVNCNVAPSEVVCIVGSSGAIRSSLLSLLLRLHDPATGGIEMGGIDIRHLQRASMRSRISLVPQEPGVIDGTIADNIAFGRPQATPEEVAAAARLAMADEFIDAFPVGYETIVGEQGAVLTGGQRYKLALARTLIHSAPILVLDEPTAGLDPVSTAQVWRAVRSVAATHAVLVLTDDLEIARRADRTYVLDKGATVESGDHDTLLGRAGRYSALWSAAGEPPADVLPVDEPSLPSLETAVDESAAVPDVVVSAPSDASAWPAAEQVLGDVLAEILGVERVAADSHFFEDLGADSMVMARYCARLRKQTDLASVSMKQVYEHPTISSLAAAITDAGPSAEVPPAPTVATAHLQLPPPVGSFGYAVCGFLQVLVLLGYLALLAFALSEAAAWIAAGSSFAENLLRSAAVGNGTVVGVVTWPIVVKWALIGRWKPQQIRVWSLAYVRFWVVKTFVTLNPIALFAGTPIYNLYLRALGATIERNVVILSRRVPVCSDLLTIGARTVIRKDSLLNCYRAHSGLIETGRVTVGRDVYVGELTVLDIDTTMGDGAQLGHSSSLLAGQSIPPGEHRCGSPAVVRTAVDYRAVAPARITPLRKLVFSGAQLVNWLVGSSLVFGLFFVLGSALADRAYFATGNSAVSSPLFYTDAFLIAGALLFVIIVVRLVFVATVPRVLNLAIEPGRVYPLYGVHHLLHRGITRLTNVTFFTHLFGDSSYIVTYLRWLGYDLSESVVQTGSNFGSAVKHDSPYLVSIGRGTMIADGLSLLNADYSNTSFRLSQVTVGADNFLGNQVIYPAQGRTGANCLLATKVMVPVDGDVRENVGLLGAPSFEIPRSVLRDSGLNHPQTEAERDRRLAAKNRHNLVTIALFLAGEWVFFFASVLVGLTAVMLSPRLGPLGPLALALAALLILVSRVLYQTLLERTATSFRTLSPLQCSIYDRAFWSHERYWKLAVRNIHLAIFAGTPLKTLFWRLMGAKIGRRVFDDGAVITERTMVTIGDHTTLNAGSVVQSHSQEDGGFKRDRIVIGAGCTIGANALVHYGATVGDGAQLAPGAFLMKGAEVPADTRWQHNPAQQVDGDEFVHAAMRVAKRIRSLGDSVSDEMEVKQLA